MYALKLANIGRHRDEYEARDHLRDVRDEKSSSGYEVTAILVVLQRHMREHERENVLPPQSFFDDGVDVDERVPVFEIWQSVWTNHGVELSLSFPLDFWI